MSVFFSLSSADGFILFFFGFRFTLSFNLLPYTYIEAVSGISWNVWVCTMSILEHTNIKLYCKQWIYAHSLCTVCIRSINKCSNDSGTNEIITKKKNRQGTNWIRTIATSVFVLVCICRRLAHINYDPIKLLLYAHAYWTDTINIFNDFETVQWHEAKKCVFFSFRLEYKVISVFGWLKKNRKMPARKETHQT